jgi:hypothetical protein
MRGPLLPYAMYRLLGVSPEEVPEGTEIWSDGDDEALPSGDPAGA